MVSAQQAAAIQEERNAGASAALCAVRARVAAAQVAATALRAGVRRVARLLGATAPVNAADDDDASADAALLRCFAVLEEAAGTRQLPAGGGGGGSLPLPPMLPSAVALPAPPSTAARRADGHDELDTEGGDEQEWPLTRQEILVRLDRYWQGGAAAGGGHSPCFCILPVHRARIFSSTICMARNLTPRRCRSAWTGGSSSDR
jgi:hypothetical protein